jgi:hypothetical protein
MNHKLIPMTPDAQRIKEVLNRSEPLKRLRELLQESRERLEIVEVVLPYALRAHIKAGPVDEKGWTLLVANSAVASKLKQLQPRMEEALQTSGRGSFAIRIKVQAN